MNGRDGHTVTGVYEMTQNCTFKKVKMITFVMHIPLQLKKEKECRILQNLKE